MVRMILRCTTGLAMAGAAMYGAYTVAVKTQLLSNNPTTSLIPGLYIRTFSTPDIGSTVKFKMPQSMIRWLNDNELEEAAEFFSRPENGLMKTVVAKSGDTVCVTGENVNVNGKKIGELYHGMLEWHECRAMAPDELFVMTPTSDGIDSRMYGPVKVRDVRTYGLLKAARDDPTLDQ